VVETLCRTVTFLYTGFVGCTESLRRPGVDETARRQRPHVQLLRKAVAEASS
jgi:hypothetical protein